jgi:3-ketosteroid 9alpha-monooxygenase subunit B
MSDDAFELKVVDVVEETADAHSISFEVPAGAEEQFAYKPGQFLTLAVPSDQTGVAARCYSLSSSPVGGGPLTITVKRTAEGYASNWVCDNLREGDSIHVLPPSGIFTPASLSADLLLFAGGSGITPVISITRTALEQGTGRIVLFYANRDEKSVIFARELTALAAEHPDRLQVVHWLESVQGLPSQDQMRAFASAYSSYDAFVCGPAPFMKMTIAALKELEFPRERRHQEKFISLGGNPFGDLHDKEVAEHEIEDAESDPDDVTEAAPTDPGPEGPVKLEVELDGQNYTFDDWAPGTKLLDHLEAKGI